jgi:group I intron endonuclease
MLTYPTPPKGGGLYVIWLSDEEEPHYYGGRTYSFKRRWRTHLQRLQKGVHKNPRMQATFNKYGVFRPEVLTPLHRDDHPDAEQAWLNEHYGKAGCVNLSPFSVGGCGPHSERTKAKMRAARARQPSPSPKTRVQISRTLTGFRHSPETRAKMRARTASAQTREKMSKSAKKVWIRRRRAQGIVPSPEELELLREKAPPKQRGGWRHTREAREKIAASKKGVKRAAFSPEHRQKMADARRGKQHSEETKAKIGKANRTRVWTEESRQKASSSKRGRRWICHHTEGSRLVPSCEVQDYFAKGWVLGRSTE